MSKPQTAQHTGRQMPALTLLTAGHNHPITGELLRAFAQGFEGDVHCASQPARGEFVRITHV